VVEVGGVGLLLRVSATTAARTAGARRRRQPAGTPRGAEDALDLYGFATPAERGLFEAFLSVGVSGPAWHWRCGGVAAPDELRLALARGDSARLQAAPGVASAPPSACARAA